MKSTFFKNPCGIIDHAVRRNTAKKVLNLLKVPMAPATAPVRRLVGLFPIIASGRMSKAKEQAKVQIAGTSIISEMPSELRLQIS